MLLLSSSSVIRCRSTSVASVEKSGQLRTLNSETETEERLHTTISVSDRV